MTTRSASTIPPDKVVSSQPWRPNLTEVTVASTMQSANPSTSASSRKLNSQVGTRRGRAASRTVKALTWSMSENIVPYRPGPRYQRDTLLKP